MLPAFLQPCHLSVSASDTLGESSTMLWVTSTVTGKRYDPATAFPEYPPDSLTIDDYKSIANNPALTGNSLATYNAITSQFVQNRSISTSLTPARDPSPGLIASKLLSVRDRITGKTKRATDIVSTKRESSKAIIKDIIKHYAMAGGGLAYNKAKAYYNYEKKGIPYVTKPNPKPLPSNRDEYDNFLKSRGMAKSTEKKGRGRPGTAIPNGKTSSSPPSDSILKNAGSAARIAQGSTANWDSKPPPAKKPVAPLFSSPQKPNCNRGAIRCTTPQQRIFGFGSKQDQINSTIIG